MRPLLACSCAALLLSCAGAPTPREREGAQIHTDLGIEALRAGRPQDALREFDDAIRRDPSIAEAYLGRGLVLEFSFGQRAEAEKAYRKAIALKPNLSEAHNNLGQLLAREGKLEAAIAEFDLALDNMYYREPFVARCNKGEALLRLGRREEGFAQLRTCLSMSPHYCAGNRDLGRALLADGKAREALVALQRYAEDCPKQQDAHYQVGLADLKLGDAEGARAAFGRCDELDPTTDLGVECRRNRDLLR